VLAGYFVNERCMQSRLSILCKHLLCLSEDQGCG
jgi:hypothetical protein